MVAIFTFTFVGPVYVETASKAAALILTKGALIYIMALVFASNVHEVEAFMTLADVTSKSVDTLPISRAGSSSSGTFINIHTGPAIWSQLQARRGALAPDLSFDNITAILTVRHGARQGTCNECDWLTQRKTSITEITMCCTCPESVTPNQQ